MKATRRAICILITALFTASLPAFACTGITVRAADGTIVRARTLEFGTPLESDLIVVPRGYEFAAAMGAPEGLHWTGKYGFVSTNALGLVAAVDGVNEKGLSGGLFYFPGYASYPKPTADKKTLAPWDVLTYALSTATTVDEAVQAITKVGVSAFPLAQWGFVPPVHYLFADASGKSVVLEYTASGPTVYPNTLGVMTNSPTYDWHMTNLSNYVGLTDQGAPSEKFGAMVVNTFGEGGGLRGLPGDFTSPSRFARAVAFSTYVLPSPTAQDAVLTAFHLLNNFDIPKGVNRSLLNGKQVSEYTEWTAASDLTHRRFYVRTFADSSIRMVDLLRCNLNAKDVVTLKLNQVETINDMTPSTK